MDLEDFASELLEQAYLTRTKIMNIYRIMHVSQLQMGQLLITYNPA